MLRRVLVLASAAMVASACASSGSAAGSSATTASRGSHNVLAADEMAGSENEILFDTIRRLRPAFLRQRNPGFTGSSTIDVYINGTRAEGIDALRNIQTGSVKEVRFYEPQDANVRFGTGHEAGVIAVTLK